MRGAPAATPGHVGRGTEQPLEATGRPGGEGPPLRVPSSEVRGGSGRLPEAAAAAHPRAGRPPLLLGDHQDVVEQEQVARRPAGEFPEEPGLFRQRELPALQQPAGGGDQRQGLGDGGG